MVQARFNKPYNTDLVSYFNNAWARNESVAKNNAAISLANAKQSDSDLLALANFSPTLGGWIHEVDKKQEIARTAEEKMSVFLDLLFENDSHETLIASTQEDNAIIGRLDDDDFQKAKELQENGASYNEVSNMRVTHGVRGKEIAELHVANAFARYGDFMKEDPNKVYVIPGGKPFTLADPSLSMDQKKYARMSRLREFFSQEEIGNVGVNLVLPYMHNLLVSHRAWERKAEIETDFIASENDRKIALASYNNGKYSAAKTIEAISITRDKDGNIYGYDGAMEFFKDYWVDSIKGVPISDKETAYHQYTRALNFAQTEIPKGFKDAGKKYKDAYPNRWGSGFRAEIEKAFKAFRTDNNAFQKQEQNDAQDSIIQSIKQRLISGDDNYSVLQAIEELHQQRSILMNKYGSNYTDNEGAIQGLIEDLTTNKNRVEVQQSRAILKDMETNYNLDIDDPIFKKSIANLPLQEQQTWENKANRQETQFFKGTKKAFSDVMTQLFEKENKTEFKLDHPGKLTGTQLGIRSEVVAKYHEVFTAVIGKPDEKGIPIDHNKAALIAETEAIKFFTENGGQWTGDYNINEKGRFYVGELDNRYPNMKLPKYEHLLQGEVSPVIQEYQSILKELDKELGDESDDAFALHKEILHNEGHLNQLGLTKEYIEKEGNDWGKIKRKIPDKIKDLSGHLQIEPLQLINLLRETYQLPKIPSLTGEYSPTFGTYLKYRNTSTGVNQSEHTNAELESSGNYNEALDNDNTGFAYLLDTPGFYSNPPLTAAIIDSKGWFENFEITNLWELDDILDSVNNDPNKYLATLKGEELDEMQLLFWRYGILTRPPIRDELLDSTSIA